MLSVEITIYITHGNLVEHHQYIMEPHGTLIKHYGSFMEPHRNFIKYIKHMIISIRYRKTHVNLY